MHNMHGVKHTAKFKACISRCQAACYSARHCKKINFSRSNMAENIKQSSLEYYIANSNKAAG